VAPRQTPSLWWLRCAVLVVASWALINTITVLVLVVPLATGRLMFRVAQCPEWLLHDPLCFLFGCILLSSLASFVPDLRKASGVVTYLLSLRTMPLSVAMKGWFRNTHTAVRLTVILTSSPIIPQ